MSDKRGFVTAWLCALAMALLGAVALLAASAVSAHAADEEVGSQMRPGNYNRTVKVGEYTRTFLVHVPEHFNAAKLAEEKKLLPVVVMLHGAGGSGAEAAHQTGWDKMADKEDFLAVFPDALPAVPDREAAFRLNPRFWNDGSKRGTPRHTEIDDIAFLGAVLDDVSKRYPVDPKRLYLTGFSSGASMTFHAVDSPLSDRIAAAAPVSGHFYPSGSAQEGKPTPLVLIFGTKDPLNPMEGGPAPTPWNKTAVEKKVSETVDEWAKVVGCSGAPAPISDEHGIKRVAYGPGKDGVEFLFWTIDGMGHHWPGSKTEGLPDSIIGPGTDKMDATDAIWKFLSRHTLSVRAEAP